MLNLGGPVVGSEVDKRMTKLVFIRRCGQRPETSCCTEHLIAALQVAEYAMSDLQLSRMFNTRIRDRGLSSTTLPFLGPLVSAKKGVVAKVTSCQRQDGIHIRAGEF